MKTSYCFIIITIAVIFSSCAISRKIPYQGLNIDLHSNVNSSLSIAVWDQREQVLTGKRKPDFVGYLRSGAGIAYPMGTESGRDFVDDIAIEISSSFKDTGTTCNVILCHPQDSEISILNNFQKTFSERFILIKCNELHTDGYTSQVLFYNLKVTIYNKNADLIAQKTFAGKKELGSGIKYKVYIPHGLKKLFEEILNDPTIFSALNNQDANLNKVTSFLTENITAVETTVSGDSISRVVSNSDIIYLTDGSNIKSKIIEITDSNVKYKSGENLDGSLRNISKNEVFMIIYKNGSREIFQNNK